jgi:hypothetical protein
VVLVLLVVLLGATSALASTTPPPVVQLSEGQWSEIELALGLLVFFSVVRTVSGWRNRG